MQYEAIKCKFSAPVARQPALPWQQFCAALVGGRPNVNHKGEKT